MQGGWGGGEIASFSRLFLTASESKKKVDFAKVFAGNNGKPKAREK
jgi:hypothetical protein